MKIVVTNKDKIAGKKTNKHEKYEFTKYEVTKRSDFKQVYVAIYEIAPGKAGYPFHYHKANSEAFYIISGEGILRTFAKVTSNFEEIKIKKGDIIVCPEGKEGAHQLINTSLKDNLVYIDFDTTNSPDIVHYPDSNKIGVIVHNESSAFYKEDDNVDYYENE